jgi:hypothetical protein
MMKKIKKEKQYINNVKTNNLMQKLRLDYI